VFFTASYINGGIKKMKRLFLTSGGFANYPKLHGAFTDLVNKNPDEMKILLVSAYPFLEAQDDAST